VTWIDSRRSYLALDADILFVMETGTSKWIGPYLSRACRWWGVWVGIGASLVGAGRGRPFVEAASVGATWILGWWLLARFRRSAPGSSWLDARFPYVGLGWGPRLRLAFMLGAAVLFWALIGLVIWGLSYLPRLISWFATATEENGHPVDENAALTAIVTAVAALIAALVAREKNLLDLPAETPIEVSVTLGLISVSMLPVALGGGWLPNLMAAVILPIIVVDIGRFRSRRQSERPGRI
jgi:hypothetical protein